MTVEYNVDVDEAAEFGFLWTVKSVAWRRMRSRNIAVCAACAGIAGMSAPLTNGLSVGVSLAVGAVATLLVGGAYAITYTLLAKWQMRRYFRDYYSGRPSIPCRLELRPTSAWIRQGEVELSFDWSSADRIHESERGVELWFHDGLVVAPKRTFAVADDERQFLDRARALAGALRSASRSSAS